MMVNLANEVSVRGYSVDVVLAEAAGPYLAEINPRVRVYDLGAGGIVRSVPALVRYFRTERPKFVISALSHANLAAIIARMISGVKTRLIISERSVLMADGMPQIGRKDRIVRYLMKFFYRHADGIVAISKGVQDDLEKWVPLPAGHVRTIYNPVINDEFESLANAESPHPWFSEDTPIILGVGRLTAQKDFSTLLRAFSIVRKRRKCRLIILGEGERRTELETLVDRMGLSEDVILPGFQNNPFPWMRLSSLFVFSSIWEGLGGVLIQAMACGTPVISTNCPSGPAEILEYGKWGRLVPVGNEHSLAEAIEATLDEPQHPDVRKRAAFFSVGRSTDEYLAFCKGDVV